jgi:DNA-binding transcriptional ArsR family regulator
VVLQLAPRELAQAQSGRQRVTHRPSWKLRAGRAGHGGATDEFGAAVAEDDDLVAAVDLLQLIGEPTRVRLLALLAAHELTVAEIVAVTQLAQSSVSTHLGTLREAGPVRNRRAGPRRTTRRARARWPVRRAR